MTIPNMLTILRIVLVPVIVILLMQGAYGKALVVLAISGMTDGLDGFIARYFNQQTVLGAYLDPIADKALLMTCFITLSIKSAIPGWLTVIVISRDCMILVGIAVLVMMEVDFRVRPSMISKLTTVFQLLTLFTALLFRAVALPGDMAWILYASFAVTAGLTIASGLHYLVQGVRLMQGAAQE